MATIVSQKQYPYSELIKKGVRLAIEPAQNINDGISINGPLLFMTANLELRSNPEKFIFNETTYDDGSVTYTMPEAPEFKIVWLGHRQ